MRQRIERDVEQLKNNRLKRNLNKIHWIHLNLIDEEQW